MKKIFVIVLFSIVSHVFGQDLRNDLMSYYQAFTPNTEITISISFQGGSNAEIHQDKTSIISGNEYYYMKTNSGDVLITPKYYILINHEHKKIVLQRLEKSMMDFSKPSNVLMVDSSLSKMKEINYLGVIDGEKLYVGKPVTNEFSECKIELNAETLFLDKITQVYAQPTEEGYTKMVTNYQKSKNIEFSLTKVETYIDFSTKNPVLQNRFSQYELIKIN